MIGNKLWYNWLVINKECVICKKHFDITPSREKKSKTGIFCCSSHCLGIAFKKRIIKNGPPLTSTSFRAGRLRAWKMFPDAPCRVCGKFPAQRHHKDNNPLNNVIENIDMLCMKHHIHADYRLQMLRNNAKIAGLTRAKTAKRNILGRFI